MGNQIHSKITHGAHGLVFHPASQWSHHVAVFLVAKRIQNKEIRKILDHRAGAVQGRAVKIQARSPGGIAGIVNPMLDQQRIPGHGRRIGPA